MLENLGDIYHLSMIIAGFYLLFLATVVVLKVFKKDKNNKKYNRRK